MDLEKRLGNDLLRNLKKSIKTGLLFSHKEVTEDAVHRESKPEVNSQVYVQSY